MRFYIINLLCQMYDDCVASLAQDIEGELRVGIRFMIKNGENRNNRLVRIAVFEQIYRGNPEQKLS